MTTWNNGTGEWGGGVVHLPNAVHPLEENGAVFLVLVLVQTEVTGLEWVTKPQPLLLDQYLARMITGGEGLPC